MWLEVEGGNWKLEREYSSVVSGLFPVTYGQSVQTVAWIVTGRRTKINSATIRFGTQHSHAMTGYAVANGKPNANESGR
jgi:hypothetical protein